MKYKQFHNENGNCVDCKVHLDLISNISYNPYWLLDANYCYQQSCQRQEICSSHFTSWLFILYHIMVMLGKAVWIDQNVEIMVLPLTPLTGHAHIVVFMLFMKYHYFKMFIVLFLV